jgi:5,10-methylenetetrahydromethanopterin reductase
MAPRFGLNRFDARSVDLFAADVRRAEDLGWDAAWQPDSQLRRRDTYVLLAAAARATRRVTLGPLLRVVDRDHRRAGSRSRGARMGCG